MRLLALLGILSLVLLSVSSFERSLEATGGVPAAPDSEEPSTFIRFVPDGDGGRLETAVTEYRNPDGVEVVLYSAVHIGEPGYYEDLQKRFEQHDALLYELVAPKGTRPRPGRKAGGVISMFQRALKRGLGLEFQLDGVDYSPKNFVHADLSPRQFSRLQREKGESILTMLFDVYMESFKRQMQGEGSEVTSASLLHAFAQPDARRAVKLLFAKEMENAEAMLAGIEKNGESVIVTERNKECFRVLDEEIDSGRKKLGVFYGGAHLPDMERRLWERGFTKSGEEYLPAWVVPPTESEPKREADL